MARGLKKASGFMPSFIQSKDKEPKDYPYQVNFLEALPIVG